MKYKSIYLCLALLLVLPSCNTRSTEQGNIQKPEPPNSTIEATADIIYIENPSSVSEEERLRENPYMFSFANSTGDKLLICTEGEGKFISDIPHTYNIALDENGDVYSVNYLYSQDYNYAYDNGRQVDSNFNYIRGIVYQIEGEPLKNDAVFQSYLMCTAEFLEMHRYLKPQLLKSNHLEEIKQYIEHDSNREVNNLWQETEYENGIGFYFAYFKPMGNNLLAAAIFCDGSNIGVCYYPTKMDDSGTSGWNVEDYGKINDLTIKTFCSLKSEESIDIFFYWYGLEGVNVNFLEWDGINLKDKGGYGRYTLN